jgi:hypothetical protein
MADSPWTELADQLDEARRSILAEIRSYPPPITACDQQFNYLLEQRDRITEDLGRLALLQGQNPTAAAVLLDFIDTSECIPQALKARLVARWNLRPGATSAAAGGRG